MPICLSRIKRYSATDTSECALMVDPHARHRLPTHAGQLERDARFGWALAYHPPRDGEHEGQEYSKSAHDLKFTIASGHPDRRHHALPEPATGRDCSLSTTLVSRRGPPSLPRAELGIHVLNRRPVKC